MIARTPLGPVPGLPGQAGFSLVEVLVAALILAGLGLAVQTGLISTVHGVGLDRLGEAKRRIVMDLLERFGHSFSDLETVFPAGSASPAVRTLELPEVFRVLAIRGDQAESLRSTLAAGGITGFTMVWHRGIQVGGGPAYAALRLDKLWVHVVIRSGSPGANVDGFRVFSARGPP